MKAYSAVMCLLLGVEGTLLGTRSDVGVNILRTPGQLYQEQANEQLSNLYNYKLINKTYADKLITMRPENFKGSIEIVGHERLTIPKGADSKGSLFIYRKKQDVTRRKTDLKIAVYEGEKKIETVTVTFLGPFSGD